MTDLFSSSAISAWYAPENRSRAIGWAFLFVLGVAGIDYIVLGPISFGPLYLFPILMVAGFLVRWQIFVVALLFSFLREADVTYAFQGWESVTRLIMWIVGYAGMGFFVREVVHNRQNVLEHLRRLQEQVQLRQDAEEQLRVLVASSPAAIVIVDGSGRIVDCNQAADGMFGADPQGLRGTPVR